MNAAGGGDDVAGQRAARGARDVGSARATVERHVIVVGFGLAGRAAVNSIIEQGISYTVIESNPEVVDRCIPGGLHIIRGDARDPEILRQAGIDRATDIAVTVPNDEMTLAVVEQARKLSATARIIARCTFVSGGMEATQRGADDTVIAEQVVAQEFGRVMGAVLEK
ncbi:MAG: trk/ktr system potassium uptake protein [Phycisphaerales bacterium]|jgi:CPA2 family monovalent cation:H+ antiporter-2|nr:trk/ktr system potassium uptake protein [Phycisphaerales bacterium]